MAIKNTTNNFPALDVRKLNKNGQLDPGRVSWMRWSIGDATLASIEIRAEEERIIVTDDRTGSTQEVDLDFSYPNIGGKRTWFLCPRCNKRVALIYGRGAFACRHCLNLAYASQSEREDARAMEKIEKLRAKLGWSPGMMNLDRDKPTGMHWRTFNRLQAEHDALVNEYLTGLVDRCEGLARCL